MVFLETKPEQCLALPGGQLNKAVEGRDGRQASSLGAESRVTTCSPHLREGRRELKVIASKDIYGIVFQPPQAQLPFIKHLQDAFPTQSLTYAQKEVLILIRRLTLESRLLGFESQICLQALRSSNRFLDLSQSQSPLCKMENFIVFIPKHNGRAQGI